MRAFIAVEIEEAVRRRAAQISRALAAAFDPRGHSRAIAWVPPQNLHLTLKFLGEIDEGVLERVKERLAAPFATPPFEVGFSGLGTFPPAGPPRVIWLGVSAGAGAVSDVARDVEARLSDLGFPREARGFHAHLTLGRVKGPVGARVREAMASVGVADAGRCLVDRVTLFESRLSPSGASYSVLAAPRLGYHHTS
jgi:2'-5' RNA ligase